MPCRSAFEKEFGLCPRFGPLAQACRRLTSTGDVELSRCGFAVRCEARLCLAGQLAKKILGSALGL